MGRNVPGSFALFGGNAFAYSTMGIEQGQRATFLQTSIASMVGSVTSILVACPLDVVKTRIQSGSFGDAGGVAIIRKIVAEEGLSAFFKGSIPKVYLTPHPFSYLLQLRSNKNAFIRQKNTSHRAIQRTSQHIFQLLCWPTHINNFIIAGCDRGAEADLLLHRGAVPDGDLECMMRVFLMYFVSHKPHTQHNPRKSPRMSVRLAEQNKPVPSELRMCFPIAPKIKQYFPKYKKRGKNKMQCLRQLGTTVDHQKKRGVIKENASFKLAKERGRRPLTVCMRGLLTMDQIKNKQPDKKNAKLFVIREICLK